MRCYSMSSSPAFDDELRVTVKRVPGGLVSNWMNDHVAAGDWWRWPPAGFFQLTAGGRRSGGLRRRERHHPGLLADEDGAGHHHPDRSASSTPTATRTASSSDSEIDGLSKPTATGSSWSTTSTSSTG